MPSLIVLLAVATVAGCLGGAFNAILSHDTRLLPLSVGPIRGRRVIRPGLAGNIVAGTGGALGVVVPLAAAMLLPALATPLTCVGGAALGAATARCLSADSDNCLLRAALARACDAPAAHPEMTRAIEIAPADRAFLLACDLAPFDRDNARNQL